MILLSMHFKRDEDGTLKLSGLNGVVWMMELWDAVKVEDGGPEDGADVNAV